jgi:hypothetical protein
MTTLLMNRRFTQDSIALGREARRRGWDSVRAGFSDLPDLSSERVVVYADTLHGLAWKDRLPVRLLEPALDWLCHLPRSLTRREVRLVPWSTARTLDGPRFLKAADDKWFPSRVYPSGGAVPAPDQYADDAPVLIADTVRFVREYRCFVREGRVATASLYIEDGARAEDEHGNWRTGPELEAAVAYAHSVSAMPAVSLPAAVGLDVGLLSSGEWAVVEANPVWAAGLCACDPAAVLDVLERAAEPR